MKTKNRHDLISELHYHVVPLVSEHIRKFAAAGRLELFGITALHIGPECDADSYLECDCDLVAIRECIRESTTCCECDAPFEWRH